MTLDAKTARLARLCAHLVLGDWDGLAAERRQAPDGEPDREWREAVLQGHLFAGFPRAVQASVELDKAGGLGTPEPDEIEGPAPDPARGRALFDTIYAQRADDVRAVLENAHPDFATWVEEHAYARVLARPGLSPARRELLAVAMLAATGQDRQLASHARGAVRCGADASEVMDVLEAIADLMDPSDVERARAVIAKFAG